MLNEFDAETKIFKFLPDVRDSSMLHEFKTREEADEAFLLIEIEREKEGIRFTLHLSDLFSSVAIEGGSMESGCRFANGITGGSAAPDAPG
jgi:hypothetical protein